MNRKRIYAEVDENLSVCEGCFVQRYLRKEKGRTAAHQFCLSQCTVGEKLKKLGKELTSSD